MMSGYVENSSDQRGYICYSHEAQIMPWNTSTRKNESTVSTRQIMEQRQNNTCYSIQQTDAKTQKKHSN
jgi:hypothetical protein